MNKNRREKLGIALVGLGTYSTEELGPALKETVNCYLAGVVSGDAQKRLQWKTKHELKDENVLTYDNFDNIAECQDIDIVYVALPNAMHAQYVMRAAKAGKHVISEKPMATTIDDCRKMIEACKDAGVRLSLGYRLHFDPFNQEMMRLGQNELLGPIKKIVAKYGFQHMTTVYDYEWKGN